jgi:hypothetical protein
MNFRNILQEIEKTDPEVYERLSGRRDALKSFGSKVALAALPIAISSLFKKAYGKSTDAIVDALNYALELEYFEYTFFRTANNTVGLIPASDLPGFQVIEQHEKGHLNLLINTITAMGGVPFIPNHYSAPTTNPPYVPAAYDFTKGGVYATFSDYATFLMMAQVFEDTVVRAYQGLVAGFAGTSVFTTMYQIAATEGRHAAHARLLRRNMGAVEIPAPWINNDIAPKQPDFQANYLGEANTQQLNVVTTSLPGLTGTVPQLSATAAFDEPLDKTTVLSLLGPFMLP